MRIIFVAICFLLATAQGTIAQDSSLPDSQNPFSAAIEYVSNPDVENGSIVSVTVMGVAVGLFVIAFVFTLLFGSKKGWWSIKGLAADKNSVGFFEEEEGVYSSTRLFSFILLLFYIICVPVYMLVHGSAGMTWTFVFFASMNLVAIFVPKQLGQYFEMLSNIRKG